MRKKWIERIHPTTKLAVLLSLTINVFFLDSYAILVSLFIALWCVYFIARIGLAFVKWMMLMLFSGLPVILLVFIISGYERAGTLSGGAVWGIREAGIFLLRLGIVLLANVIVIKSTSLKDLTESLRGLRIPEKAVLFFTTILRFLPMSIESGKRIIEVQRCRGFRIVGLANPKNFLPVFVPLFVSHMRISHDMALSLEIRYFNLKGRRGKTGAVSLLPLDVAGWALSAALFFTPCIK